MHAQREDADEQRIDLDAFVILFKDVSPPNAFADAN